jgi:hypothetical protein
MTPKSERGHLQYNSVIGTFMSVVLVIISIFGARFLSNFDKAKKDIDDIKLYNINRMWCDSLKHQALNQRIEAIEKENAKRKPVRKYEGSTAGNEKISYSNR